MNYLRFPSVHAGRAERWLGLPQLNQVTDATTQWYGEAIAVAGVPGRVFSHKGDLVGTIRAGKFGSYADWCWDQMKRRVKQVGRSRQLNTGFASLSDLITEAASGKQQNIPFVKSGAAGAIGAPNTLWFENGSPSAGSEGAAPTDGTNCTNATAGSFGQSNPSGSDTLHITNFNCVSTVASQTILLFDRMWHTQPTVSTAAEYTVVMALSRYSTTGSSGTSKSNFFAVETVTALAATAHTWQIDYVDDSGNAEETSTALAGLSSCIAKRLDHSTNLWFHPLNSSDLGISDLRSITLSANLAAGSVNCLVGHPLGLFPLPGLANCGASYDLVNSAFNLAQVQTDACLCCFELSKGATTATTYQGYFTMVAG